MVGAINVGAAASAGTELYLAAPALAVNHISSRVGSSNATGTCATTNLTLVRLTATRSLERRLESGPRGCLDR